MEHEFERRRLFLGGGPVWHSTWPPGRVEPNRRIYDYELVYFANGSGRIITGERFMNAVPAPRSSFRRGWCTAQSE